jgi:ATP-dependent Clp protease ATP-binding subunit ClpB
MNFNNFTIKAQEAVQKASEIAVGNQQQAIEPAHLLKGLLLVDENVITYLLKKLNVNLNRLNETLDAQISSYPKVSGSNIYLSSDTNSALQKAQGYLKEFKDEFVSVEHILLGILAGGGTVSSLLKDLGVNEKDLKKAVTNRDYDMILSGYYLSDTPNLNFAFKPSGSGNLSGYSSQDALNALYGIDIAVSLDDLKGAVKSLQGIIAGELPQIGLFFEMNTFLFSNKLNVGAISRETRVYSTISTWYFKK